MSFLDGLFDFNEDGESSIFEIILGTEILNESNDTKLYNMENINGR